MSRTFGWWDFFDGAEPQMICRDTDERIVNAGPLSDWWRDAATSRHPNLPGDRWRRFEYRHPEFRFPFVANWRPETGRAFIDYNLSSDVWREEFNSDNGHPPYGAWVRVDDMVPDAFWCWPGMLDR